MTVTELLESVRRVEVRTNRFVNGLVERGGLRIPKGFRPKAQGCEARATLGNHPARIFNRNAVAAIPLAIMAREIYHNPVGVESNSPSLTQGSCATLGWKTQSRWDCRVRRPCRMMPIVNRHS
jgi:hypothetical protein